MQAPAVATGIAGTAAVLITAFALACTRADDEPEHARDLSGEGGPDARADDPPYAQRFRVDELRLDRDAPRSASDAGGRAWVEGDLVVPAASLGRWTIRYEAGPLGVAVGGGVRVTIPPFWRWSPGQVEAPDALGFVTASTAAAGVELALAVDQGYAIHAEIRGRALRAGERVDVVYGAGPARARADPYAERESPFWVAVDGDGDGVGGVLADSPTVQIVAGPPARLLVTLPSTARPGDEVTARVALLDRFGNAGVEFAGDVVLLSVDAGLELEPRVRLAPEARGLASVPVRVTAEGVHRLLAQAVPDPLPPGFPSDFAGWQAESNPLEASARAPRILWADLHGHSNLSDGSGTPEDYLAYARDVAALDVIALTDHDHWGMLKLDAHPALWERIAAATRAANEPGRFVTLLGYEWTSWIHGHRHVLYFADDGDVLSSVDERFESPVDLWAALRARGTPALTFAHHSAGGPIATNWDIAPDPELEPVTEVSSVHGSSEAANSPGRIYAAIRGNFVRDALDRGYRLGFVGSGDSHDGHPGLAQLNGQNGGLAAILCEDLTREAVLAALRERRCYATNGARIILRAALGQARMGTALPAPEPDAAPLSLFVHAIGTAPLARIELIRAGAVAQEADCAGAWDFSTAFDVAGLVKGEYVYVRVLQSDRGTAWSSPFFVE
jgi:hypothetical protein